MAIVSAKNEQRIQCSTIGKNVSFEVAVSDNSMFLRLRAEGMGEAIIAEDPVEVALKLKELRDTLSLLASNYECLCVARGWTPWPSN